MKKMKRSNQQIGKIQNLKIVLIFKKFQKTQIFQKSNGVPDKVIVLQNK